MTNPYRAQIDALFTAELQFRLASAVRLASALGEQPLDLPLRWSHGSDRVEYGVVALRPDQGDFAAWCMHRTATYMLAMSTKEALGSAIPDPKSASDSAIRGAYQVSRLIRNAFAHAPFDPRWSIDQDCQEQVFEVGDIVRLDTSGLNGKRFDWRHYGGPLALLELARFVRIDVLGDQASSRSDLPAPKDLYVQGDVIFRSVRQNEPE